MRLGRRYVNGNNVTIISLVLRKFVTTVRNVIESLALAVTPNGSDLYVACMDRSVSGKVSVISTAQAPGRSGGPLRLPG